MFLDTNSLLNQFENWFENLFTNVSAQGTFLVIAIIASVLLVISLLMDGIFDWLNFGDGPLSLTTIGAFGGLFGWVGYAAYGFGAPLGIASLLGALVGVAGGVGAFFLSKFFQNSTTSASFGTTEVLNTEAIVSLPIPGNGKYGEVALIRNGQRYTFSALADAPIRVGKTVKILSNLSNSSVFVEEVTPATDTPPVTITKS